MSTDLLKFSLNCSSLFITFWVKFKRNSKDDFIEVISEICLNNSKQTRVSMELTLFVNQ